MPQPSGDLGVTLDLAAALVREQRPDLAHLPLRPFAHGWDNETFALGDSLLVRLPRRLASVALLAHEQLWLPTLSRHLPVDVPVPRFAGAPSGLFGHPWSIVPRLAGTVMARVPRAGRGPAAEGLADALVALHLPAPEAAPHNPFRGVPLAERHPVVEQRLRGHADWIPGLLDRWLDWSAAPPHAGPKLWLHGDPHPLNLLLDATGRLTAMLDWGDLTAGDPATDLACGWLAFDAPDRERFLGLCRSRGDYDDAVWARAKAWALALASAFADSGDPALAPMARHALGELAREH